MAENINSRLNKKVFIVGKVYDTATMTDQEITDAVQKNLDEYIGKGIVNFGFHTTPNMISLVFIRFTKYYKEVSADLKKIWLMPMLSWLQVRDSEVSECQSSSR